MHAPFSVCCFGLSLPILYELPLFLPAEPQPSIGRGKTHKNKSTRNMTLTEHQDRAEHQPKYVHVGGQGVDIADGRREFGRSKRGFFCRRHGRNLFPNTGRGKRKELCAHTAEEVYEGDRWMGPKKTRPGGPCCDVITSHFGLCRSEESRNVEEVRIQHIFCVLSTS